METANKVQIPLTTQPLSNVKDIQWSADTDLALIVQTDGVYLHEIPKFNFATQTIVKIGGTEVNSPVWDPTNPDRLAFIYTPASGEKSLAFSDRRIQTIDRKNIDIDAIPNPRLVWSPDARYLLLIGRATNSSQNDLWVYATADGSLRKVTENGGVLDASFSPSGGIILYETYSADPGNPLGSSLNVVRVNGTDRQPLNLAGKVSQAAWKDDSSFFLPEPKQNALILNGLDGSQQALAFSFPDAGAVQGMFYFAQDQTLIFYTSDAIYTAAVAL
jgi:dipeptidyl aminopeptidase/acylaminoacyl peptidase